MVVPVANLSAVVTGAVNALMALAVEMLPADVARVAALEGATASVTSFLRHVWAWLVAATAVAVKNVPAAAAAAMSAAWSGAKASGQWLEMAGELLHVLYGWLVATIAMAAENLPAAAPAARSAARSVAEASEQWLEMAAENLPDAAAAVVASGGGAGSPDEASGPSQSVATSFLKGHCGVSCVLLVLALLAAAFLCGVVWALTCRTMKGPGLGGARIPRAMFKVNPRLYYATVRAGRKARRSASEGKWKLLVAALMVACAAYLIAKTLY